MLFDVDKIRHFYFGEQMPIRFAFSIVLFSLLNFKALASSDVNLIDSDEAFTSQSDVETLRKNRSRNWGLGFTVRNAGIPYVEGGGANVSSLVPMMFYDGDHLYWSGLEGGIHLWEKDDFQLNAIMRMRFFDLPVATQNDSGGDTGDLGLQLKRVFSDGRYLDFDLLSDIDYRYHGVLSFGKIFETKNYYVDAMISARYKDANFNSFYYGLSEYRQDGVRIGAGLDFKAGAKGRYHLISNLYLVGAAYATYFDKNVRDARTIDVNWQGEVFGGIAFFNDNRRHGERDISTKPYLRVAHGWATPSNIGDILLGETVEDPHNNQMTSIAYGHPLTDELFGIPLDVYITPIVAWHWDSKVQSRSIELVGAIKAYYTIDWPTKWRVGLAEGLSYINRITYMEQKELNEKGYKPSQLLNYIDFSLDVNVGDLVGKSSLNGVWLGYSVHHRSAIFENSSQFARIKGGSNYNTVYVQFDF